MLATARQEDRLTILHRRDYSLPSNRVEQCVLDILDRKRLADFFATHDFDVVIHAAGIANVDYVERHVEETRRSNLTGTQHIVELVRQHGVRLVYVSSNAVFDGQHAPYREGDSIGPVNAYGRIKVECERLVTRRCPDAVIVRPIFMYGWHAPEVRNNQATWIIERLKNCEPIHLVTDVYENPLWSHHGAEAIWRMIQLDKTGTFHVAGSDIVNRYEFAKQVALAFDLDTSLLRPVDSSFFSGMAPRPRNTSFLTVRMQEELGMEPLPLYDGLERMRALAEPSSFSCPS